MNWPDGKRFSCLLLSLVVSLLLFFISTLVFSRTGGVLSHQNSSTYRFPSVSHEKLVLPRHARCALSHFCCNEHCLPLSSYLTRIRRIENPSCSACGHPSQDTSYLILYCPGIQPLCAARSLAILCLSTISGQGYGELPGFWIFMVFRHAPHPS